MHAERHPLTTPAVLVWTCRTGAIYLCAERTRRLNVQGSRSSQKFVSPDELFGSSRVLLVIVGAHVHGLGVTCE